MFYIQHRIGAQSNVLLSAHYAPTTTPNGRLSKESVFFALRSVIEAYPELSLIGVPKASSNGKKHLLLLAALHEIDLETCVEFLDDHEPASGPEILERLHNEWLWTDETFNPQNPWWKIAHQRTKTRIASFRIPAAKMRQIIFACREQKASFTPLILAMICCTLAIDHYPEAKIGISNCALDVRSLYPENTDSSGKLLQCAGGVRKVTWLSKYRHVFGPRPGVGGGNTNARLSSREQIGGLLRAKCLSTL
ncbi:hypothetical protein LCI18_003911 [Fusarium solani-melongenae]|uniref:Uncharacterized protein n=1 Tax=Fusarium solani subsp. cucurbitae TaxID=2747967 RepID=A0ACD3YWI3_FUSSC|nr:hypothetical protein LCI18_003911 [Fusarium solani-melongenae]